LRRLFGSKKDELTGEWRKLHNEELNDLYTLPNIVRVVQLRRMRRAGYVARMGEDRVVHRVLVGTLRERGHWGHQGVNERVNMKMDLQEVRKGRGDWM
jgi:hypothetical protein